jgi:Lon protease-like protein
MQLPKEVPVMTLPNATLFPKAMLPLYIFEPRYRQMLADALDSHRMVSVAMLKPGRTREIPSVVAGLGLIRASVANRDGSSHLILQGLARVELEKAVKYKPYRIQRIRPLVTTGESNSSVEPLTQKVMALVGKRLEQGLDFPIQALKQGSRIPTSEQEDAPSLFSLEQIVQYLATLDDPDQMADLVSCALLTEPIHRQMILEAVELETRLRQLITFLEEEIRRNKKKKK